MQKFAVTPLALEGVLLIVPEALRRPARLPRRDLSRRPVRRDRDLRRVRAGQRIPLDRSPGTIRGLHFQRAPATQAKLVGAIRGAIFRRGGRSAAGAPASYGRWCAATLTASTGAEQLFVPRGFAHGFCTLEPDTEVAYKMDDYITPDLRCRLRLERSRYRRCVAGQGPRRSCPTKTASSRGCRSWAPIHVNGTVDPIAPKRILVTGGAGFIGSPWCVISSTRRHTRCSSSTS